MQKQESSCSGSQGVCAKCQGSCGDSGSGVIRVRGMTPSSQRLSSISLLSLFLQFCFLYNNMQSRTDQRSKVISIIRVFNLLRHFSSTHTPHRSLFFHFSPIRKLKNKQSPPSLNLSRNSAFKATHCICIIAHPVFFLVHGITNVRCSSAVSVFIYYL